MWVILPVKRLQDAKLRLANIFHREQRARFSYLMCCDVLATLELSASVQGITIISSDPSLAGLAEEHRAGLILTESDGGYSSDAMEAISTLSRSGIDKIAILPSDVPQLTCVELDILEKSHKEGITLCPALMDGGTNGLVFSPPLEIPLLFGPQSCSAYQRAATAQGVSVTTVHLPGLERDIDRPEDVLWLREQKSGGRSWLFAKNAILATEQ